MITVLNCNIFGLELLYNEVLATLIAFSKYKSITSETGNINMQAHLKKLCSLQALVNCKLSARGANKLLGRILINLSAVLFVSLHSDSL